MEQFQAVVENRTGFCLDPRTKLLLMAVVGTIVGLTSGMTEFNFSNVVTEMPFTEGLFGAIVSLAFAFEGWICATSIGSELKDSKKNMPRALLIGTVIWFKRRKQ